MLLCTFLRRDDLDIIHCLPETLPVENEVNLCAVVAGTVGNQVGHSLSEAGISHHQVVCQGKLQQSLSFHIPNTETFAMMDFLKSVAVSTYVAISVSQRYKNLRCRDPGQHTLKLVVELVLLPSIFKDKSVISPIPTYFKNKESPIICYKYNKPIRSTVFNYNKLVTELDIKNSIPDS